MKWSVHSVGHLGRARSCVIAIVCLVSGALGQSTAISVDPPFGFLNQTTEFVVSGATGNVVSQCTTYFGQESQSVFSSESGTGGWACTVVPPEDVTNSTSLYQASLSLVDAQGEAASEDLTVPFVRLPTIQSLSLQMGAQDQGETVTVRLADSAGLQTVLASAIVPAHLTVPTLGSGNGFTVQAPVAVTPEGDGALITFALDTEIPAGAYPVLVSIRGHALSSATSEPLLLSVSRAQVSLSVARVTAAAIAAASPAGTDGTNGSASDGSASGDAQVRAVSALALRTDRGTDAPVRVLLTVVRASIAMLTLPEADAGALARYPEAPATGPVTLAAPASATDAPSVVVTFPASAGPSSRRVTLSGSGAGASDLVLRIVRVEGGGADPVRRATLVSAGEEDAQSPRVRADPTPAVVYRGVTSLDLPVKRSGAASPVPSVVAWTVAALDDSVVTTQPDSPLLLQALPNVNAPPVNLTAVLGATSGTLVWPAYDTGDRSIRLPVDWDSVPYTARWQLALQLSPLWNAEVPAPPRAPSGDAGGNATAAAPAAAAALPRADVSGLVYGVAEGTCPPGGRRVGGGTRNIPVLANAQPSDGMRGIMLRSRGPDAALRPTYVPPTPAFFQNVSDYAAVVQHGSVRNEVFIVVRDRPRHVRVLGCSVDFATAAETAWTMGPDSDAPNNLTTLSLAVPLPSPLPPTPCTLAIHVCLLDQCTANMLTAYTLSVTQLSDPAAAQLASVQVTLRGATHVLCAHSSALAEAARRVAGQPPGAAAAALTPAAEAVAQLLVTTNATDTPECGSHSVLSARVLGVADSMLTVDAAPLHAAAPGTQLAIGQRLFVQAPAAPPMAPSLSLKVAKDISDVAFPLAMRLSTSDAASDAAAHIVVDIPVTLTLADGITSIQHLLQLGLYYSPQATGGGAGGTEASLSDVSKALDEPSPVQQMDQWPQDPMNGKFCRPCPLGSWTYSVDAATCLQCKPGTAAPRNGLTQCLVCTPGTYSPIFGASICARCLPGFYAPTHSSAACRLCPAGYTAAAGGAATCATKIRDGVQIGVDYALAVYFTVMIRGTNLDDVPAAVGVDADPADVVRVLVSADTSVAFNISTSDIEVTNVQQVSTRTLQVDVTANLGMHVPPDATQQEIEAALAVAQLSKDQGIGNLSWSRTTQALGADAQIVEDAVTTQVVLPEEGRPALWPTIVFPLLACLVVLSTFLTLRYRKVRERKLLQPLPSDVMHNSWNLSSLLFGSGLIRSDSTCSGPDTNYRSAIVELSDSPGQTRKRGGCALDTPPITKDELV